MWPERLSASKVTALASNHSSGVLQEALAIVDAKSLYDYLSKETIGGQEDLQALSGQIRRIDHPAMISNGLTRIKGSNEALYRLIRSGGFSIQAEKYQMEIREAALKKGISQSQIRRIGIKEKGCMTTIGGIGVSYQQLHHLNGWSNRQKGRGVNAAYIKKRTIMVCENPRFRQVGKAGNGEGRLERGYEMKQKRVI